MPRLGEGEGSVLGAPAAAPPPAPGRGSPRSPGGIRAVGHEGADEQLVSVASGHVQWRVPKFVGAVDLAACKGAAHAHTELTPRLQASPALGRRSRATPLRRRLAPGLQGLSGLGMACEAGGGRGGSRGQFSEEGEGVTKSPKAIPFWMRIWERVKRP